jgi:mono/diheme cytochrome c family protein
MSTKRVICPNCSARLKLADGVEEGKRILCPKCSASFVVPAANGSAAPATKPGASESDDGDSEKAPRRRKKRKKLRETPKPADTSAKILFAATGSLVYVVCAVGLVFLVNFLKSGAEASAQANPGQQAATSASAAAPGGPGRGQGAGPMASRGIGGQGGINGQGMAAQAEVQPQAASSQQASAGEQVFSTHCARCHISSGGRRPRGPKLPRPDSNLDYSVDSLMAVVRDPRSQNIGRGMPAFGEEKISDTDLRALAQYVASLK